MVDDTTLTSGHLLKVATKKSILFIINVRILSPRMGLGIAMGGEVPMYVGIAVVILPASHRTIASRSWSIGVTTKYGSTYSHMSNVELL